MQQTIEEQRVEQLRRLRGLLDRREAGEYLNCSAKRVDDLRKAGVLVARRDGRAWRYTFDDLDTYIEALTRSA
jgi:excisionase family DNA binding protein